MFFLKPNNLNIKQIKLQSLYLYKKLNYFEYNYFDNKKTPQWNGCITFFYCIVLNGFLNDFALVS